MRNTKAPQLICQYLSRLTTIFLEQLSEEPLCRDWLVYSSMDCRLGRVNLSVPEKLIETHQHITEYGEDMQEIREWRWSAP